MKEVEVLKRISEALSERAIAGSFFQIFNIRSVVEPGFEFGNGVTLRKATAIEDKCLKLMHDHLPFTTPDTSTKYVLYKDDREIADFFNLLEASAMTPWRFIGGNLICGAITWYTGGTQRLSPEVSSNAADWLNLTKEHLQELHTIKIKYFNEAEAKLKRALTEFSHLDDLPKSPFQFLGYMAVLESLITHKPNPEDPYSSLTRQVSKKMQLIGERAVMPIRYDLLDNASKDKIWKAVYSYRSQIAHGDGGEITRENALLRTKEVALRFIELTVRSVMRQWLEEPRLMASLQHV